VWTHLRATLRNPKECAAIPGYEPCFSGPAQVHHTRLQLGDVCILPFRKDVFSQVRFVPASCARSLGHFLLTVLLHQCCDRRQSVALPSSTLSKACQYALTLWRKLTRFLEYPELELSNNLAENSMRPVALGRKNWIHIGSPQAGPKVAAIVSVVESCRRLKISVRDYLASILPGLADLPIQRLPGLSSSRCI
jgi:hypothetical protein